MKLRTRNSSHNILSTKDFENLLETDEEDPPQACANDEYKVFVYDTCMACLMVSSTRFCIYRNSKIKCLNLKLIQPGLQ